jgi:HAE1 family hydrophobic/amphiphilic exporter-1
MKLSDFAVRRPVTIAMIFLLIVLLGLVSMNKLNLDLFPELDLPLALAITSYENVGPEEMEELVTRPLESALGTVNGIKSINSISRQGSSLVVLEFSWGTDMNFAINQMREKIDLISSFLPADADKTMILKLDPNMMPIIVIGFSGDYDLVDLDKLATDVIQPRLERVEGVASVTVSGGVKREIRISAVPQRLQAYGLSLEQIIAQLRMENRDVSAGAIEEGLKEQIVRVVGAFESVQEIEDLQIPLSSGGYVRLAEIARVEDTFKDKKEFVYMDGEPSVQIAVQKQTDANTVKVSEAVRVAIADLEKDLPQKSTINIGFDQAEYINLALDQVKENAYIGAGLAVLILFLFLRNLRSTLIIGLAIPIAIIATFILMFFAGLTLNIITLGGLALGIGMMVDCSIVILENIYRYRQNGYSKIAAAREGATEVSLAVTASTLTTIVVFLPIVYVEGLASQIFRPMAWTVSFALLASLVVALTLVPMLSSKILRVDALGVANGSSVPAGNKAEQKGKKKKFKPKEKLFTTWGNFLTALDELYRRILGWSIQHRKTVVFLTLGLFIMSIAVIPLVGMEFLPQQDSGEYTVNISLPNGTAVRETQRVTKIVEQYIEEMPEHEWAIYAVGLEAGMISSGSTPEKAIIRGKLTEKRERTRSLNQVLDDLRNKCASIPGAKIEINALDVAMGGLQSPIEIGLTGDNLEVLEMLAQTIATRVKEVEGAREVKTSIEDARPEVHLKLQRKKAEQYGINTTQLSSLLSTAINGTTATRYREKGEEIDVRIVLDEQYRRNINDLESLMISSPYGSLVHLRDVAEIEFADGPTQIERKNQARRVTITGDIYERDLKSVVDDIQSALDDLTIPPGIQLEFGGAHQEMVKAFGDLSLALILAIVLVYMILAAQFEGLLYPFVIMFSIPPTLIGVVFALLFTGRTLSIPTFVGIIMLAGIVVNNAIVLVDYINTLRRRDGLSREEAILKAGPTRLRPILMTALTTILALLPLTLGIGEGAELSAPMATAVAGGLTVSTLITLVLIPCLYIIMDNFSAKLKRLWGRRKKAEVNSMVGGE